MFVLKFNKVDSHAKSCPCCFPFWYDSCLHVNRTFSKWYCFQFHLKTVFHLSCFARRFLCLLLTTTKQNKELYQSVVCVYSKPIFQVSKYLESSLGSQSKLEENMFICIYSGFLQPTVEVLHKSIFWDNNYAKRKTTYFKCTYSCFFGGLVDLAVEFCSCAKLSCHIDGVLKFHKVRHSWSKRHFALEGSTSSQQCPSTMNTCTHYHSVL